MQGYSGRVSRLLLQFPLASSPQSSGLRLQFPALAAGVVSVLQ